MTKMTFTGQFKKALRATCAAIRSGEWKVADAEYVEVGGVTVSSGFVVDVEVKPSVNWCKYAVRITTRGMINGAGPMVVLDSLEYGSNSVTDILEMVAACADKQTHREADAEKTRITDVTAAHELALWMALTIEFARRKRLHPETVVSVSEAHDLALAIDAAMTPVESDICDDFVELLLCIDCAQFIANCELSNETTAEQDSATIKGARELRETYKYISVGDSIGFYANTPCACCKSSNGGERFNINNFGPIAVTDIKNNVTVQAEIDYISRVEFEGFEIKETIDGRFSWAAKWECRDSILYFETALDAAYDCCKSNNLLEA